MHPLLAIPRARPAPSLAHVALALTLATSLVLPPSPHATAITASRVRGLALTLAIPLAPSHTCTMAVPLVLPLTCTGQVFIILRSYSDT